MSVTVAIRPNVIQEVTIGTQTWALYNYDFGGTPYDDDIDNVATHGKLYTQAEAIAIGASYPGWHLPTSAEVTTLAGYLGGFSVAGGPLKEIGTTHWDTPNTGATNSTGFTALPGGWYWTTTDTFYELNEKFYFWVSDIPEVGYTYAYILSYDSASISGFQMADDDVKCSIRLIKD